MKSITRSLVGWSLLGVILLAGACAEAQTTANGPYYATPSWDQTLPAATRFVVLSNFAGAAVLDRETGLVWEKSPSTSTFNWLDAQEHCNTLIVGNRKGWRLPTIQDIASLMDPSVASPGPTLPAGHPFTNVQSLFYWSATNSAVASNLAWFVSFIDARVSRGGGKGVPLVTWCVRGGQGVDPQ